MEGHQSLVGWFNDRLIGLNASDEAKAYIVGVLNDFRRAEDDLSKTSLTLEYFAATQSGDFRRFQRIGDWVLYSHAMFPNVDGAMRGLETELGRNAYGSCWRILRGQWTVFVELSDRLPEITTEVRTLIRV